MSDKDRMKSTQAITQEVRELGQWIPALRQQVAHVVVGQKYLVDRLILGLLANGHLLLEGVPGLAKTLTVKTLAACIQTGFQRLQFTPDLLPADLIGTLIYNPRSGEFSTKLGPIFSNLILADEINRAPAKVQSALLEAMQERQVTIGHQTFPVPSPFLVLATQNPIESEGTYPLPEAQVDRFMLKVLVDYPAHDEELTVVARSLETPPTLERVLSLDDLKSLQAEAAEVYVDPALISWSVDVATATRRPKDHGLNDVGDYIAFGASPRGPISLVAAARALALIRGRDYVVPADMEALARDAFRHRLVLSYRALAEEVSPDSLLDQVLAAVPMPQIDLGRREQVA